MVVVVECTLVHFGLGETLEVVNLTRVEVVLVEGCGRGGHWGGCRRVGQTEALSDAFLHDDLTHDEGLPVLDIPGHEEGRVGHDHLPLLVVVGLGDGTVELGEEGSLQDHVSGELEHLSQSLLYFL